MLSTLRRATKQHDNSLLTWYLWLVAERPRSGGFPKVVDFFLYGTFSLKKWPRCPLQAPELHSRMFPKKIGDEVARLSRLRIFFTSLVCTGTISCPYHVLTPLLAGGSPPPVHSAQAMTTARLVNNHIIASSSTSPAPPSYAGPSVHEPDALPPRQDPAARVISTLTTEPPPGETRPRGNSTRTQRSRCWPRSLERPGLNQPGRAAERHRALSRHTSVKAIVYGTSRCMSQQRPTRRHPHYH